MFRLLISMLSSKVLSYRLITKEEDKKKLNVEDLLEIFEKASSSEFANERVSLS